MKARLSFFQIWNMCFGFLGIQIAFGLQNANASRLFQTLGADMSALPLLWIAGPVTGLIVQPLVGHFSDRTWGRLGRRRPYFFWGAVLTTAALFFMPTAPVLWMAAGALWILDASVNVTMEPFRAFVGDLLPEEQRTTGYAMQSFFIGVGSVFASALPWMLSHWFAVSNEAPGGGVPESVRLAFYIGGAMLLVAVLWTVLTTREYSPSEVEAFERAERPAEPEARKAPPFFASGLIWTVVGAAGAVLIQHFGLEKELYILAGTVAGFGLVQLLAGWRRRGRAASEGLFEIVEDFFHMPATMKQLAVVQFFSWFGLFAMWIFTTLAVTQVHYGTTDTASKAYNEGADWVGVLFAVYNGVAALAAFLLPMLAKRIGRRACHALNLCLGGLGLLSFYFIADPKLLWIGMIGVGFAWASILSAPYSILAGAVPARKMGVYMGIFNFFIVIPQLVAATILGLTLKTWFNSEPIYALVLGGGSMFVAAVCMFLVREPAPGRAGDEALAPSPAA
ncbi:MFS transporter [Caulobacter sp. 17J65-9]|uniref:MFS transporter n=1 Tax=Caulobacter sp. 17J65-9 TaxID=2709382 RepID=UPI0013C9143F|nr:MFS transporter [Caulobacter sp. 17J65-9]NEX92598.1 SLC45 family MFS transporter [Caulobacter sp. 17J65-9]